MATPLAGAFKTSTPPSGGDNQVVTPQPPEKTSRAKKEEDIQAMPEKGDRGFAWIEGARQVLQDARTPEEKVRALPLGKGLASARVYGIRRLLRPHLDRFAWTLQETTATTAMTQPISFPTI